MLPVRSASTIIGAASSKRPRASDIGMRNCSYSTRASPRPNPSTRRPLDMKSRSEAFSATLIGSFHGKMTAPVTSLIRLVLAAT